MGDQLLYDAKICAGLFLLLPFSRVQANGALLCACHIRIPAWQMLQGAKWVRIYSAECIKKSQFLSADTHQTYNHGTWSIGLFIKLGSTVMITFGMLLSPFLTSVEDIQQVFHRVFPLARGLYEDKVANVWCAVNVVIKLRQLLDLQTTVRLSLAATLLAMLPSVVHLGLNPTRKRLMYGLICCSLAFFLFSFQVHEKTILLPALPITLLILEEPWAVQLFINVAMFR